MVSRRKPACEVGLSILFFQAEDGIRDLTVTGVQTCALPISSTSADSAGTRASAPGYPQVDSQLARSRCPPWVSTASGWNWTPSTGRVRCRSAITTPASVRSEEHTSELQSQSNLVCRLLLEKK